MKKLLRFGLICTIASSALLIASCAGEDGDPGATGAQGEKGDTGDTGTDGEDGAGYEDATRYGNILVKFAGLRPDDKPFEQTIDFKFGVSGPDAQDYSYVYQVEGEGGMGYNFSATRYSAAAIVDNPDYSTNNSIYISGYKYDVGESTVYLEMNIGFVTDDMKFFRVDDAFSTTFEESVTDYSFTSATGELKFHLHFVGESADTGHELDITADVNVTVLQSAAQ
jgi:hypothetical protein